MKKDEVEFHNESGPYSSVRPAINVKVYKYPKVEWVTDAFGCSEKTAERALGYQQDMAREVFWEDAEVVAKGILGDDVKIYSSGRSGGWLIVVGLPNVEKWDAILLGKWGKLKSWCRREIEYLCSKERVLDDIQANRWHEDGSEKYNFRDDPVTHETICISEMKAKAKEAGFGPVIRP